MKQIVAWVNKWDKKQFEKFTNINIYFASSIDNFDKNLNSNVLPVLSLGLASVYCKKIIKIFNQHPNLKFYFLDKPLDPTMTLKNMDVRDLINTEEFTVSHSEVVQMSLYPDQLPKTLLERRRKVYGNE
jgi:uncharacterized protein YehS (DUF1456 family)